MVRLHLLHQSLLDIKLHSSPAHGVAIVHVVAQQGQKHSRQQGCNAAQQSSPPVFHRTNSCHALKSALLHCMLEAIILDVAWVAALLQGGIY